MLPGSSELTSPVQAGVGGGHLLHPAPQLLAAAGSQGRDVPGPRQPDDRGLPHLGAARMDQRSLRQLLPGQDLGQGGARAGRNLYKRAFQHSDYFANRCTLPWKLENSNSKT